MQIDRALPPILAGVFGAGQKQDDPFQAQPPFGSMHNQPAFGQSSAVPTFGAQPPGQAANPFGQPGAPAFGMGANQQQPQPGAGNGGKLHANSRIQASDLSDSSFCWNRCAKKCNRAFLSWELI